MRRVVSVLALCLACRGGDAPQTPAQVGDGAVREYEPPAATNAESPVHYPARLYDQSVEGTVMLRLFVTATGSVVAESTRVAESSGYAALDSAAVAGVPQMTFAPARRNGQAVAAAFLQPVYFRRPEKRGRGTGHS